MFASAGVVLEGALATDDGTLNRLDDDEHLGDLVGQDVAGSTGGWTVIATQGADNRGYSAELVALDEDVREGFGGSPLCGGFNASSFG